MEESVTTLRYPADRSWWPTDAHLDAALIAETTRSLRRYSGPRDDSIRVSCGTPVVLTAPHAVAHRRGAERKRADVGTGLLVDLLGDAVAATTIVAEGEQSLDGNFHPASAFRRHLSGALADASLVLDVHGMSDQYGPDVCLGTGRNPLSQRPVQVLARVLSDAGFSVAVDDPYDASRNDTITRHAHREGVPAAQIEVARRLRRPFDDPDPCLFLVEVLRRAVVELSA